MRGQPAEESAQHAAVRVVHRVFERRTRPRWHPRWVADDEWRTAWGKEIGFDDLNLFIEAESRDIFLGAIQGASILIGGDNFLYAAARAQSG